MAFLGHFFYTFILGRFAKMPPPQCCQKIEKKCILRDESGGKNIEKSAKMTRFSASISIW